MNRYLGNIVAFWCRSCYVEDQTTIKTVLEKEKDTVTWHFQRDDSIIGSCTWQFGAPKLYFTFPFVLNPTIVKPILDDLCWICEPPSFQVYVGRHRLLETGEFVTSTVGTATVGIVPIGTTVAHDDRTLLLTDRSLLYGECLFMIGDDSYFNVPGIAGSGIRMLERNCCTWGGYVFCDFVLVSTISPFPFAWHLTGEAAISYRKTGFVELPDSVPLKYSTEFARKIYYNMVVSPNAPYYRDYRPIIKDGGLLDLMIRSSASASKALIQALVDSNEQIMYGSTHTQLMYNGTKFIVGNDAASVLLDARSDVSVCP
jgi:hypothetical protein